MREGRDLRYFVKVTLKQLRFVALHFSVLDRPVVQKRVQFHRLVSCCTVFVLFNNQANVWLFFAAVHGAVVQLMLFWQQKTCLHKARLFANKK